jgi:hypothetical protein
MGTAFVKNRAEGAAIWYRIAASLLNFTLPMDTNPKNNKQWAYRGFKAQNSYS